MTCCVERGRFVTRAVRLRLAPGRGDPFSASAGGELPSLSLSSSAAGSLRLRSGAVLRGTGGLGASGFGASPICNRHTWYHARVRLQCPMPESVPSGGLHMQGAAQQAGAMLVDISLSHIEH